MGRPRASRLAPAQEPRRSESGILLGRDAELGDGIRMPAALLKDDPQVVMDEGTIAAATEHGAEVPLCFVEPTGLQCGDALREALGERRGEVLPMCRSGHRQQEGPCRR